MTFIPKYPEPYLRINKAPNKMTRKLESKQYNDEMCHMDYSARTLVKTQRKFLWFWITIKTEVK